MPYLIQEGLDEACVLPRREGDGGVEQVDQPVVQVAVVHQEQPLDELGVRRGEGERRREPRQPLVELKSHAVEAYFICKTSIGNSDCHELPFIEDWYRK